MKINNIDIRVANIKSVGDHFEIKVKQEFDNQFYEVTEAGLKLRISLDTALKLVEFIDREMDDIVKERMGVGV
jgi:hypothetical protein